MPQGSPRDSRAWLISLRGCPADPMIQGRGALRMSYYTGPSELALIRCACSSPHSDATGERSCECLLSATFAPSSRGSRN